MDFSEYGNPTGKPVVYFHGVPGSPSEASIFDAPAREQGLRILCFDRFAIVPSITGAEYYRQIAQAISETVQGTPVDFIGFSLGTHAALEVSALMPGQVRSLHLISAAAPLDGGDFLDQMAGKAVFSLAQRSPSLFQWLVK
jgi:pimeloyl-ACP methyl ester carboxylesterase